VLDDLRARLKATRFAPDLDDDEVYGLSTRYIRPLVQHWTDGDPPRISAHWKAEYSLLPDVIRRPATLAVPLHLARRSGFRPRPVRQVSTFGPGRALAVPGRPLAIAVPGHTMGSTAHVFPVTASSSPATRRSHRTAPDRPRLHPRQHRRPRSLAVLAAHDTPVVLPGHGQLHRRADHAVARTRQAGISSCSPTQG
jgi:glyoxylase-like metal-dependent hydrolase (beta-lactamase superfamily II)